MSEEVSDLPKELLDSVKDAVGRKIKLSVKKRVKLESKGDKMDNRVLALASHRAYLLTARIPTKIEQSFNYLEIQGISCNKPTQLVVEHERGVLSLKMVSTEEVNEVVAHIGSCLQRICPGLSPVKVMKKLTMEPSERISGLQALWETQKLADPGPCGGFSQMYRCVCDWLGLPYKEEVQWDVDTIYLTQDTRELNLQDFSHLENRDLVAIIAVLEYNQWFTKLSTKDSKLSADVCDQILKVVARSSRLEDLVLDNAGLKTDFAQKLAGALAYNPVSGLQTLSLANNPLEDRGISSLGAQFAKLRKGLKHLNFSKTSLSPKGVNSLAQSLSANPHISSSLIHLDLSGNTFRGDDMQNFYNFLAQPNSLMTLDLSNTDCSLDQVCSALLRGSTPHLSILNVSKSVFPHRKGKDVPPSFKHFFSSAMALSCISLSGTKLPPEALKALLLGLASNPNLKEVTLDISCCELRSGGSQIMEGCIAEIPNISSLDISDNGLDSDLSTLLVWLAKNRSIRHLALGKNFNNIKSKNLAPVLDNLVHMIQEEESPLTSLSLADSKLKTDLTIVLNALGSNSSLTKLDISGNAMGDMGAKMLAKALQINTKLRTVIWDKNNSSPQGLQDVAAALEKNYTLRFMPIPIVDASQALKTSPEKTEDALLKIEHCLYRNHETRKYQQEQAYRLQQGIVTTTTQQMIDRICVKVQDHLNSLRNSETDAILEDVKVAENLMKDARNSKTLLPNLYHLGVASREEVNGASVGPIQEKLESMAGEVARVMDEQLQSLLESMVDAAEGLCPHVMRRADLRQDLITASTAKMVVPRSFVRDTLLEQSGVDIINKISEVKLSLASFLSDRIVDEILEALSGSQHTLADHLVLRGQPLVKQGSVDLEVPEERVPKRGSTELLEAERLDDLETCMMTPKSKRKSIHSRMLRPVSRAFEMEFDLDKALEDVPVHVEDPPASVAPPRQEKRKSGASASVTELPSEESKKLQHFTKLRPRRNKNKTTQSSKSPQITSTPSQDGEQNGLMGRVDEGVEEFFSKKVTKMDSKRSLKNQDSQDGEKKKKGGFLNLIKSRSSKSDKNQASAPTSVPAPSPAPAPVTAVPEEPSSPRGVLKSPTPDLPKPKESRGDTKVESKQESRVEGRGGGRGESRDEGKGEGSSQPTDCSSSSDRSEELRTPDSMDEPWEGGEGRGSPQGGRRYGVQVMGSGLLAEMKAKQERRAAGSHKGQDQPAGPDSSGTAKPPPPESRSPSGSIRTEARVSPERPPTRGADARPEAASRVRSPSSMTGHASPKPPPPQGAKPSLAARPSIPQKPRTSSSRSIDESSGLKRAPSEKEGPCSPLLGSSASKTSPAKEVDQVGDTSVFDSDQEVELPVARVRHSPQSSCSTASAEEVGEHESRKSLPRPGRSASVSDPAQRSSPSRTTSNDHKTTELSPKPDRKDRGPGRKTSDSGEEADKDFIFI
ncbi:F-actin-uncapping protein LRRC16A-like isoform X1 [Hypomesus transpacificus]|uniref:F-actin-uncapping protein LRRC16A-like isoform X1 n=1 Tax=Hypomesus transpacificus TaxID=137520 RepID=UPI001F0862F9|nr:F-actin-uncapping protein LRRC16A-like isoform X1 [Hypomesus transpacificus]